MLMYNEKDVSLLNNNINKINEEIEKKKEILCRPTQTEINNMKEISDILLKFIKDNKRKIYGGYAINMLIKDKNIKDAIYSDNSVIPNDKDIYSPTPIEDLINISNILHKKGFNNVIGQEALHQGTYKLFVDNVEYCDISYVPKNIYNNIQFKEIDNYIVVHPLFIFIDFFRQLSDPMNSYHRMEKQFQRFYLLQKYYPFPENKKELNISQFTNIKIQIELKSLLDGIYNFICDKKSLIIVGLYAYEYFLMESKIKKYKNFEIPFYEIISINYRDDTLSLIKSLQDLHPVFAKDIVVKEHYPFFQFLGYSAYIYYKDVLIAIIYHYNKRCTPFLTVQSYLFQHNSFEKKNNNISIGTFSLTFLYCLINIIKARVNKNEQQKNLYYAMLSHLIESRNYYFKINKKNIFDNTIFRDFIIDCKGEFLTPEKERLLLIKNRKEKGKPLKFKYDPSIHTKEAESNYVFLNSSGNEIITSKNLKLSNTNTDNDNDNDIVVNNDLCNIKS